MSDAIFLPDDFTETLEIEAKLAQGRDGRGELPQSFWETYSEFANSQGGTVFLGLKEVSSQEFRAAVVTAQVEGFVSNRRLQEVCCGMNPLLTDSPAFPWWTLGLGRLNSFTRRWRQVDSKRA